ncbi:MAG: Fe(3+) ABC transporter substrate-binding protein [Gammaproteobacteria bacterium]|nr:MAG: Fe(3+) ABC transporter substrate-binding protein [Gammaproteobacteria bacterium]
MKPIRTLLALTALALATPSLPALAANEVNLYSARKEELIKPLLDRFTAETGITVNLVTGKADALLKRLDSEGRNTPADLLLTTDAGRLYRAYKAGVLQPVRSKTLESAIPPTYRDPEGYWFGVSIRARVLMYAKDRLDPATLSSYEDLADSRWQKRICIRSSGNIYNQSLVASLIVAHGEAETETWAKGLVANLARPPRGGDRDQIKAVAAGQCDVAVANTYYLGTMLGSADPAQREAAAKIAVYWPNQVGRGTHVNISGAGVTRYARNLTNAVRLLEFMVTKESQRWYADANLEYPVLADVPLNATLEAWGPFKADSINLAELGRNNAAAVRLMDRAGWK